MKIGYAINEYRQQLVFYTKIYKHYWRYGRFYDYKKNIQNADPIPKIIHYCWFGRGELRELMKNCIRTWGEILPEYKVMLWNEDNFPYKNYPFANQALKDRKWAFVSDVARLHALYYFGGIYMDTDVEVLKPLDAFLKHGFFSSFESDRHIATGIMGAKKGNEYVKMLLDWYKDEQYGRDFYEIANTRIISRISRLCCGMKMNNTHQEFADVCYYTQDYFCPEIKDNGGWGITPNTHTIHHFAGTWEV